MLPKMSMTLPPSLRDFAGAKPKPVLAVMSGNPTFSVSDKK